MSVFALCICPVEFVLHIPSRSSRSRVFNATGLDIDTEATGTGGSDSGEDDTVTLDTSELLKIVRFGLRAVRTDSSESDPASLDIDAIVAASQQHEQMQKGQVRACVVCVCVDFVLCRGQESCGYCLVCVVFPAYRFVCCTWSGYQGCLGRRTCRSGGCTSRTHTSHTQYTCVILRYLTCLSFILSCFSVSCWLATQPPEDVVTDIRKFEGVKYQATGVRSLVEEWLEQVNQKQKSLASDTGAASTPAITGRSPTAVSEDAGALTKTTSTASVAQATDAATASGAAAPLARTRSKAGRSIVNTVQHVQLGKKGKMSVPVSTWSIQQAKREMEIMKAAAAAKAEKEKAEREKMGHEARIFECLSVQVVMCVLYPAVIILLTLGPRRPTALRVDIVKASFLWT